MPRLKVEIYEQKKEKFAGTWRFRVGVAWTRDGHHENVRFEQFINQGEYTRKALKEVNDNFANSIRICKHHGGYLRDGTTKEELAQLLNKLSSTDTGIGIRISDDPLKEFERFLF